MIKAASKLLTFAQAPIDQARLGQDGEDEKGHDNADENTSNTSKLKADRERTQTNNKQATETQNT
jgi:hypothetical protein